MSEKQFRVVEFEFEDNVIEDVSTGDQYDIFEIVDLLNSLYEENEKLKRELHIVETDCKNAKESRNHYREENEQLKKEREKFKDCCLLSSSANDILQNEIHMMIEKGAKPSKAYQKWKGSVEK